MKKREINERFCIPKKDGTYKLNKEECIYECSEEYFVYRTDSQEKYAVVKKDDTVKEYDVEGTEFKHEVRNFLREKSGLNNIDNSTLKAVIEYLSDKAFTEQEKTLTSRAHYDSKNNRVLIDYCDGKNALSISKDGIEKIVKPVGVFQTYSTDLPQVKYVAEKPEELPRLLKKITRMKDEDILILATYICVCLFGNSKPIPILFLTGPQGSAKTSTSRYVQRIIDPNTGGLFSLSDSKKDIAIAVSKRLLCVFDNTGGLKKKKAISDLLCTIVTKGAMNTRKLYTTKDEALIHYRSALIVNGIDYFPSEIDLLERCLMVEMPEISVDERKTEAEMERVFNSILPSILGAVYAVIEKVLGMADVEVSQLSRMADYESLSAKCAVAMGYTVEKYQKIIKDNITNMHRAFLREDITVRGIELFMGNSTMKKGSMSKMQMNCYNALTGAVCKSEQNQFPKSGQAFSRKVHGLKKQLEMLGITYTERETNKFTEITFYRN